METDYRCKKNWKNYKQFVKTQITEAITIISYYLYGFLFKFRCCLH